MKIALITILSFIYLNSFSQEILRANRYYTAQSTTTCYALGITTVPTFAYSFRSLNSCYAGQDVRIRRASDNTESDVGFVSGFVDTAFIKTFIGSSNAYVTKWYDQSGNFSDMAQSVTTQQPQIATTGALIYANGKLSIFFDGVNDMLNCKDTTTKDNASSFFLVSKRDGAANTLFGASNPVGISYFGILEFQPTYKVRVDNNKTEAPVYLTYGTTTTLLNLVAGIFYNGGQLASDGNTYTTATNTYTGGAETILCVSGLLRSTGNVVYSHGYYSEAVLYNSDQRANLATINSNIKTYYGF